MFEKQCIVNKVVHIYYNGHWYGNLLCCSQNLSFVCLSVWRECMCIKKAVPNHGGGIALNEKI